MPVWTSLCFWRDVFCTTWSSWTSGHVYLDFTLFHFYSIFIRKKPNMEIQCEPLSQEFLNFSGANTWTSFNKPFKLLFFYTFILTWNAFLAVIELLVVSLWTSATFLCIRRITRNWRLDVIFCHFLKHVIGGQTSCYEPCTEVHVNFLQQIWVFLYTSNFSAILISTS